MKRSLLLAMALLLMGAATAQAGWVIQETRGDDVTTIYIDQGRVRLAEPGQSTIFDTKKGTISWLDLKNKRQWSGSPEDLRKLMQKAYDQEVEKQLKPLSPEDREKYRKAIAEQLKLQKNATPPEVIIKPSGESARIAGYQADKYNIWVQERLREERWLAKIPGLEKDLDLTEFSNLVRATYPPDASDWRQSQRLAELGEKGYPLKTIEYDSVGPVDIMVVTRVEEREIPEKLFQAPKGFKQGNPIEVVE
jgi:hypothetical protein